MGDPAAGLTERDRRLREQVGVQGGDASQGEDGAIVTIARTATGAGATRSAREASTARLTRLRRRERGPAESIRPCSAAIGYPPVRWNFSKRLTITCAAEFVSSANASRTTPR